MSDRVLLSVPAKAEFARTVRLTAASLAMRAGMTFDEVEEVKLATEEAFIFVGDRAGPAGSVDVAFEVDGSGMTVDVGPVAAGEEPGGDVAERAQFARFILEAVCDELTIEDREQQCAVRLVKRAGAGAAGA